MDFSYLQTEQWVLFTFLDSILAFHKKNDSPGIFNKLIQVNSKTPELSFNRIFACKPEVAKFYNELTQIQKAYLVPRLKLYRISKETGKDEEISFENNFNAEEFRKLALGEIDGSTRIDGSAIKKITISDRPESLLDVHLTCKIDLYFDNILALNNSKLLQLVKTPERKINFDSKDYRIKLIIGWNVPVDSSGLQFTPDQLKIISETNIAYLLELTQHSLNFRDNGAVDLSIEYQGALESTFKTNKAYDIFALTDADKNDLMTEKIMAEDGSGPVKSQDGKVVLTKLSEYALLLQRKAAIEKFITDADNKRKTSLTSADLNKQVDSEIKKWGEELKKIDAEIADKELTVIRRKYVKILQTLKDSNRIFKVTLPGEFFVADETYKTENSAEYVKKKIKEKLQNTESAISAIPLGVYTPIITTKKTLAQQVILSKKSGLGKLSDSTEKHAGHAIDSTVKELQKQNEKEERTDLSQDKSTAELFLSVFEETETKEKFTQLESTTRLLMSVFINSNTKKSEKKKDLDDYRISYILLGDLLNSVLPNFDSNILIGSIRLNSGPINLTQIPISVPLFITFFINNIIREKKRSCFLWDFITDIVRDLIIPQFVGTNVGNETLPNINITRATVLSKQSLQPGKIYEDTELANQLSRGIFEDQSIFPYLIIYCYSYDLPYRKGDEKEDNANGIYHFGIGKQVGIVKGIQFSKVEQPKVRDIRLTGNEMNRAGEILREHYNITMSTIGNPLFINGSHFYFDGSYLGEAGRQATQLLGLGGYYLVHGIETTIQPGKFDMQINGFWQSLASIGQTLPSNGETAQQVIEKVKQKSPGDK